MTCSLSDDLDLEVILNRIRFRSPSDADRTRMTRHQRRVVAQELCRLGWSKRAIGQRLRVSGRTLREYLDTPDQPAPAGLRTRPRRLDLTGQRFGAWTVLSRAGASPGSKASTWTCRCDCGQECTVRADGLRSGKSVGCLDCVTAARWVRYRALGAAPIGSKSAA